MSYKSAISWTDGTWNPIIGCSKISAGCANCYAERMACRQSAMGNLNYAQVVNTGWKNHWNGKTVFVESALTKPLHWRKPRKIFVCSMSDLFHESVSFEWIDRVFAVMALCPQHQFMCLTKWAGRMREYIQSLMLGHRKLADALRAIGEDRITTRLLVMQAYGVKMGDGGNPPYNPFPNVHLGVTVENQDNVGRIADLIQTPAAKRFVSFEPLLGDVYVPEGLWDIDYAFIGCESGPRPRLCSHTDIKWLIHRCRDAAVKIHIKQIPLNGKCNKKIDEWPNGFKVREI